MTRRVALIGKPLRRPHSRVMHDAAFAATGIDGRYELREIEPDALTAFTAEARGPDWLGFQVTAPYKMAVMEHLDRIEDEARLIGAVNSVVREGDGTLTGFNTDAPGLRAAVESGLGVRLPGAAVVVAGAGGAARAACAAMLGAGAGSVTVAARDLGRATALVAGLGDPRLTPVLLTPEPEPSLAAALATADLVVNATTVGMLTDGVPLPVGALRAECAVFDCVYVPAVTPFVRAARARGLRAANGDAMLVAQAAIAFARWTGVEGMEAVMRGAIAPLLADPSIRP